MSAQKGKFGQSLGTVGQQPAATDEGVLQKRIADLEAQLQSERVESGRVKALSQRNKELEKALADASSREFKLPDEIAATLSPEVLKAIETSSRQILSRGGVAPAAEGSEATKRLEDLEKRMQMNQQATESALAADMERRLDEKYPGLSDSIGVGGDKNAAWENFLKTFGPAVKEAWASHDFARFCEFVDLFLSKIGASQKPADQTKPAGGTAPSGQPGGTPSSGAQGAAEGETMTFAEYEKRLERLYQDHRFGTLAAADYQKKVAELERALEENRVTV